MITIIFYLNILSYLKLIMFWKTSQDSEVIKFFYRFSKSELPKSIGSKFNLVDEVHTRNTSNNLLIYIPRMSTSQYYNHSLRSDGASLWNKFFKDFFSNHDLENNSLLITNFVRDSLQKLLVVQSSKFYIYDEEIQKFAISKNLESLVI